MRRPAALHGKSAKFVYRSHHQQTGDTLCPFVSGATPETSRGTRVLHYCPIRLIQFDGRDMVLTAQVATDEKLFHVGQDHNVGFEGVIESGHVAEPLRMEHAGVPLA